MKYYLHRISNHIDWSHPLLEQKNLLSIGWVDIAAKLEHFISEHQNDWAKVPATVADYCEKEWGSIPRSRFGLQRFLEMEQGDWIVVPTWRAFHIYEVVSDERLVPNLIENDLKDFKNWNGISPIIKDGSIRPQQFPIVDLW